MKSEARTDGTIPMMWLMFETTLTRRRASIVMKLVTLLLADLGKAEALGAADVGEVTDDPKANENNVVEAHLRDEGGKQADTKHHNGVANDGRSLGDVCKYPML